MSVFVKELVENSRVVHVFFTNVVVAVGVVLVGVTFTLGSLSSRRRSSAVGRASLLRPDGALGRWHTTSIFHLFMSHFIFSFKMIFRGMWSDAHWRSQGWPGVATATPP